MKSAIMKGTTSSVTDETLLRFFQTAQSMLEEKGEEDAAFYFEQSAYYLQQGGVFHSDSKTIARMFGL